MINVADLARRLSLAVGRSGTVSSNGPPVSAADVCAYIRRRTADERQARPELDPRAVQAIDRMLATLPRVVAEERLARRHPGFARYLDALPRIVFLASRGLSSDEIANQLTFIATDFGVDTILDLVAQTIAARTNRGLTA